MEAAPVEMEGVGLPWKRLNAIDRRKPVYRDSKEQLARIKRVRAKAIGMGQINTTAIVKAYGRGRYAARYADAMVLNGYDDWFLPSKDEMASLYDADAANRLGGFSLNPSDHWTSSQSTTAADKVWIDQTPGSLEWYKNYNAFLIPIRAG
jgi:hypothetical protein